MDDIKKQCNSKNGIGCPVKKTLNTIGGKWKPYILRILMLNEVIRYTELKRQVDGITDMMLSQSLKELEQDKILKRTQYEVIPPKVEYSLTDRGKKLSSVMSELSKWGRDEV